MSAQDSIIDIETVDLGNVIADTEEIRKWIPQRFEMEQITAIVHEDTGKHVCVGYKDVARDEFWCRGHMPGMPLMPGVILVEAAAQLSSYYVQKHDLLQTKMMGFGGIEEARFREPVIPGDRLVLACELLKARPRRMMVARFEGYVRGSLAVNGIIKGIPLPVDALGAAIAKIEAG